ncbi:MAG: hypothetical protein IJ265_13800, partial [Oscillospiraceae bacterium]|nr:hypothetical protein [Oscillospiraceae bacterium]
SPSLSNSPPDCLKDSPLKKATALGDFAHCGERQWASPHGPTNYLKKGQSKTFVPAFGFKRVVFRQTEIPLSVMERGIFG